MNPWDVQASSPIQGAINEGDVIMLLYYARAAEPAEGGSSLTARIQMNAPPWTLGARHDVGRSSGNGRATARIASPPRRWPKRRAACRIHLATAKQVIELGPVFVFNFGKGYDRAKLKGCDG